MLIPHIIIWYLLFASASGLIIVGRSQKLCLGASVTLQCTVTGDILIWKTPTGDINLVRGTSGSFGTTEPEYHWTLLQLNVNHTQSNLTFYYNETIITLNCSTLDHNIASITLQTEGPPGAPDPPLTGLDRIKRVNKTFSSVSVMWNIPTTNNAHISSYVVTVDPPISLPDDGVIAADNPLFNSQQLTLTLQHDQQYNIRVRAKSCNDSVAGKVSPPMWVNLRVPQRITTCSVLPVYDFISNRLIHILVTWKPNNEENDYNITDNISASVQEYEISFVPEDKNASPFKIIVPNDDVCYTDWCRFSFQNISELLELHYLVFLAAKNALPDGYSERKSCNTLLIIVPAHVPVYDNVENNSSCKNEVYIFGQLKTLLKEKPQHKTKKTLLLLQQNLQTKDTLVPTLLSLLGRLSLSRRLKCTQLFAKEQKNCTQDINNSYQSSQCAIIWGVLAGAMITGVPLAYIAGIISAAICYKKYKTKSSPAVPLYEDITTTKENEISIKHNQCYSLHQLTKRNAT